ncbi:MAG: methylamine utilization protein [Ignavibacteriae bacterium]|nr:methylamine utilization protein [Ignavibacteriota bacterium]NOG97513.1 methylamine utilization protein [Ignavibacteriota bacterium]
MNTLVKKNKVLTAEKTKILLSGIVYYSLALILLFTGITKIIDPLPLISTLKLLPIINEQAAIFTATLLPVIEIGLAILMLLKIKTKVILTAVTVLFGAFFLFSIYGTLAGIDNDCGCFGDIIKSEFGVGMIVRNAVFLFCSIILLRNELNNN